MLENQLVYEGPLRITQQMNTGNFTLCFGELDQTKLVDEAKLDPQQFLECYTQTNILPDIKIAVANQRDFLIRLRTWLTRVETRVNVLPESERFAWIKRAAHVSGKLFQPLMAQFELAAANIPEALQREHEFYCREILQPLIECSPFVCRCYQKPLGYAGDHKMVEMLLNNGCSGNSL